MFDFIPDDVIDPFKSLRERFFPPKQENIGIVGSLLDRLQGFGLRLFITIGGGLLIIILMVALIKPVFQPATDTLENIYKYIPKKDEND